MTHTEIQLVSVYGPLIPLLAIAGPYFSLGDAEAKRRAALHTLPVPAFRLTDSQKAPYVVKAADMAEYIDRTHQAALAQWEKSQV